MKRFMPIVFIMLLIAAAVYNYDNSFKVISGTVAEQELSKEHQVLTKHNTLSQFAWQAAPTATPIEETKHVSWWWWVLGVALVIGAGMLLYVLIKKNPRKDAR
jgi:peptidoglycan/LPS O-acetylase OafA/YrhL